MGFIVGWYFEKFFMGGVFIISTISIFVLIIDIIFTEVRSRKHYSDLGDTETLKNMKIIYYLDLLKQWFYRRFFLMGGVSIMVYYLTVKIL